MRHTSRGSGVFRTTVTGIADADKHLTQFIKTLAERPTEILLEEAPELEESCKLLVPYRHGRLFDSIHARVSHSKREPGVRVSAQAWHHGYNYALIQHENLSYHHDEGQAKFIELPFRLWVDAVIRRMEEEVRFK